MAEPTKKKQKGFFQKLAQLVKDLVEWVEETFSDAELSAEIRDDLGLDRDNPATPAPPSMSQPISAQPAKSAAVLPTWITATMPRRVAAVQTRSHDGCPGEMPPAGRPLTVYRKNARAPSERARSSSMTAASRSSKSITATACKRSA